MEDVVVRQQARERAPLRQLLSHEAARAVERPVGLGVELVAVEDDEVGVDAAPPERLHVRPRDARRVDGAVEDAQAQRKTSSSTPSTNCFSGSSRLRVEHRGHRLADVVPRVHPDLGMDEQLQPLERAARELVVWAAAAPVLVRVGAVVVRVEVAGLHGVHGARDRRGHVVGVGHVPRDDRIEAIVERRVRIDAVQRDAVSELAQARERVHAGRRLEVVELAARHQEVRRDDVALGFELRHRQRRVERHVDVVARKQVAGRRFAVEVAKR